MTLNTAGNRTAEEDQACASPAITCSSWMTMRSETYVYDTKDRLVEVDRATPAGAKVVYTYDVDGRLSTVRDENHAAANTTYGYDALGRLNSVTQTLSSAAGGSVVTRYDYDAQDNLTSVTDPNGNVTAYAFDDFGRMQRQTSAVTGVTTYSYDAAGNLISTTDATGATTTRTYDAANRISGATSTRVGSATESVAWTYDDPTAGKYGRGRLASMTDPTGSTAYSYERRGLLAQEQKTISGAVYMTGFRYDADGNRRQMTYPSGRVIDYTVDFAGRATAASTGSTALVTSTTYAPFGPLTRAVFGNGTTKNVVYDARYRVLENKLTGPNGTIADYSYADDAAGNITQVHDMVDPSFNRDYGYDDLNRLTTANTGSSLWGAGSFSYDSMGNIVNATLGSLRAITFAYQAPTPKLASVTETGATRTVTYDSAGNETQVGGGVFSYSPRNELTNAENVMYTYDGRSVRTITSYPAGLGIASLQLNPSVANAGDTVIGTVTLTDVAAGPGVTVSLSSDNDLVAVVPRSVTIASGSSSATFTIDTTAQTAVPSVAINGRYQGSTATSVLTVNPYVTSLTLDNPSIYAGSTATGSVTLSGVVPAAGTTVALTSSNPAVASVPASITIPSGATMGTFAVTTYSVDADTAVTITATKVTSASATLTVRMTPATLSSLTLTPANVVGGVLTSAGTVQLTQTAPAGGATVLLSSSNTNVATVPASVLVPAGATTTTFSVTTTTVGAATTVTITGTYGATRSATLTVASCTDWSPDPAVIGSGERVWFDDAVPPGAMLFGTWTWDTAKKASGTQSNTIGPGTGVQQYYFTNATNAMAVDMATEAIVVYALLDPCNPPQQILFQFNVGGSWEHRAYWGANIFAYGTNGTNSRRRLGDLPPLGQWVRLVIPVSRVGLGNQTVTGMAFDVADGRAWFDRVARVSCLSNVPAPASFPPGDVLWVDDSVPSGAWTSGVWFWDSLEKASGSVSHTDVVSDAQHGHYFGGATQTLSVGVGDTLFAYALISPCDAPDEIVLQWNDGNWEHRGYWGANLFPYGTDGTNSRRRMGDLPAGGQWVRLEIPASQIGLEGHTLNGLSFDTMGGKVWYDRAGVARAGSGALLNRGAVSVASGMASSGGPGEAVARPPSRQARFVRWLKRLVHRDAPPATFSVFAQVAIAAPATVETHRYSLYTPELSLMAETATSATAPPIAYEYISFAGEPLAQLETQTNTMHWYFNDHLGAPLLTTNANGQVDWRVEQEPYGTTFVRFGADRHQPVGLPGQETNDESAEVRYNIFRWYRSAWSRYTQADPLLAAGKSPHVDASFSKDSDIVARPYAYVDDNPLRFTDAVGLCSSSCPDCPNGTWAGIDVSVVAGVLFGRIRGTVTYFCTSARIHCSYEYRCTGVGLIAGASISVTGVVVRGTACKCAAALPQVAGGLNVFSVQINGDPCSGGGVGGSQSLGATSVYAGTNCSVSGLTCKRY